MSEQSADLFVFGATGDLAVKKILPALQQWYGDESPFDVIWCLGRRPLDDDGFIALVEQKGGFPLETEMRRRIRYHRLEFADQAGYDALRERVDAGSSPAVARLFFLAVKPEAFVPIAARLHRAGLFVQGDRKHRLLFEKPFGDSRASAEAIQSSLTTLADEEQVFRIDHYLGKEMIRNVLAIRFANRIFSESWHGGAIERVEIVSVETAGVEERLDYYDRAGAINDMVQSHLLQMLALVAMAPPDSFEAEAIRRRKLEVLRQVELVPEKPPILGQYRGYSPAPSSRTETFVEAALRVNGGQWPGTVFLLRTGKKLGEKRTEISLRFRPNSLCLSCSDVIEAPANELVIQVFPREGIVFRFNSKVPGYEYRLEPVVADYCHSCAVVGSRPEAYVKLLKDALADDRTLFASFDELLAQWRIADQIRGAAPENGPLVYEPGVMAVSPGGGAC
jgi:glucose-6-phosphate 1-dehydrogenase